METVWRELENQWGELVDDPKGPRHYCDSRMTSSEFLKNYQESFCKAIVRLIVNKSILEMDIEKQEDIQVHDVYRRGDIFVGVVLRAPYESATVTLEIGPQRICTLDLCRDEPCLVLENNVLPMLPVQFQAVRIKSPTPVTLDLVHGFLQGDERKRLGRGQWSLPFGSKDSWLHLESGCAYVDNRGPRFTVLPRLPLHWRKELERQKARTAIYEEELVAAAWHPARFQEWCLDMTEC